MSASDLASHGYALFINRALALYAVGAALASAVPFSVQAGHLEQGWVSLVMALLLACTVGLMLVTGSMDWSRGFLVAYAAVTFAAVLTWPLAWQGRGLEGTPFLILPLVGSVIMLSWAAREVWVAGLVGPPILMVYAWIRTDPVGGGIPVPTAALEAIVASAVACAAAVAISLCYRAGELLDRSTDQAAALAERTAISASVRHEQRNLDALVHDQVMTTLAAAGRGTVGRTRLAGMAERALTALLEAGETVEDQEPLTGEEFAELVSGPIGHAAPAAMVEVRIDGPVTVPRGVANAVSQAAHEAAVNATKHAQADTISVRIEATGHDGQVRVAVEVSDDGVGFVVDEIPEGRLGVRLGLQSRMIEAGGTATVASAPGAGTVVGLAWRGRPRVRQAQTISPGRFEDNLDFGLLILMLRLLFFMIIGVQVIEDGVQGRPLLEWLGLILLTFGGLVALGPNARRPLRGWEEVVIIGSLVAPLILGGFQVRDHVPGGVTFAVLYLALVRIRGHLEAALAGVGVYVGCLVVGAVLYDDPIAVVPAMVSTVFVVMLTDYHVRWLNRVTSRVARAHEDFKAAANRVAGLFSTLLRREVWLVGVQGNVEPLLGRLADPQIELTAADRERCVTLEARLRDSITARNLSSPKVSAAIETARSRGVTVTLVDNRNGALPDAARAAALEQLAQVALSQSGGQNCRPSGPNGL